MDGVCVSKCDSQNNCNHPCSWNPGGSGDRRYHYYVPPENAAIDRGNALFKNRDYAAAEQEYRKAVSLNPRSSVAHWNLAAALDNQERYFDSVLEYREALRLDPNNRQLRRDLASTEGYCHWREHDWSAAEQAFRESESNGAPSESLTNMFFSEGAYLAEEGDLAGAEAAYRAAIRRGHKAAPNNLGNLLTDQERWDEAESLYLEGIRLGDNYAAGNLARMFDLKGDFLRKQQRYQEAETAYREGMHRGNKYAPTDLGSLLKQERRWADARAAYEEGIVRGDERAADALKYLYAAKADDLEHKRR